MRKDGGRLVERYLLNPSREDCKQASRHALRWPRMLLSCCVCCQEPLQAVQSSTNIILCPILVVKLSPYLLSRTKRIPALKRLLSTSRSQISTRYAARFVKGEKIAKHGFHDLAKNAIDLHRVATLTDECYDYSMRV